MSTAIPSAAPLPPEPIQVASARRTRRVTPLQLVWIAVIVAELVYLAVVELAGTQHPSFGLDYRWHMEASQRLLDTGTPYYPWQFAGHYDIHHVPILYPPVAFALFVPFLWLPSFLWWAIPIAILLYGITRHRPPLWGWALTLACFCWSWSLSVFLFGNPGMWIVAFVAAGTVWSWPFALVLLKPTFAPIALLGIRHRSWWVTVAVLAGVSLLFLPVWFDWLTVLGNSDVELTYNVPTIPLMVAPLLPWILDPRHPIHAWIARHRRRPALPWA